MTQAKSDDQRARTGSVLGTFLYIWLMVGLFTGTAVLLGPVGWITAFLQRMGWAQRSENMVINTVIVLFVITSFLLSVWLVRLIFTARSSGMRYGIPVVVTLLAVLAGWGWTNPGAMLANMAGSEQHRLALASGAEFIFGPYPDRERLAELKKQGVTAVVSLQHPAVPVEVPGIEQEQIATAQLGLRFIHAPMLPWVSDNEQSIAEVRQLAESGTGKYYVHCGLGRDRVNMIRKVVAATGVRTATSADLKQAITFADRKAQFTAGEVPSEALERGLTLELEPGVWLIPHPNRHELFGYMLAGQVESVVSLLDPADPKQLEWLEEQRKTFKPYGLQLVELPVREGDAAAAREAVRLANELPKPVAIIAPETDFEDVNRSDGVARTFLQAYRQQPAVRSGAVTIR